MTLSPAGLPQEHEALVKHMVDRFLGWRLPEHFHPDAGISFQPTFNEHSSFGPMKNEPIGTNLFDAEQAAAMVRYMLEGSASPAPPAGRKATPEISIERLGDAVNAACLEFYGPRVWADINETGAEAYQAQMLRTLRAALAAGGAA